MEQKSVEIISAGFFFLFCHVIIHFVIFCDYLERDAHERKTNLYNGDNRRNLYCEIDWREE